MNFPLILLCLVLLTGLLALASKIIHGSPKKDQQEEWVLPAWAEYSRSFFPVLLIVFCIRSFLVEPFRIPTGSLEPTLLVGDFILVNKFTYGLRMPIANFTVIPVKHPQQGDIVVFHYPPNPSMDFIKRVIGTEGDHVVYKNKQLTINDKVIPQKFLSYAMSSDEAGQVHKVEKREETINGVTHLIYIRPGAPTADVDVVVPKNQYFMMGDNRDDSSDSRYWGFVKDEAIVGKAFAVWFSWDNLALKPRFDRIGRGIT